MISVIGSKISLAAHVAKQGSRNFGLFAPAAQKASDPIQALFVEKIQEYRKKSGPEGATVDASEASKAELQAELDKVAKSYGGGPGVDMTSFPEIKFAEPTVEPINIAQ